MRLDLPTYLPTQKSDVIYECSLMQNTNVLFRQNFVKILLIIRSRPNSQMWRLWIQTSFWISNHASIVRLFEIEQICGWKNGSRKKHRLGHIGCVHLWEKLRLQWKWIKSLQIWIHLETKPLIFLHLLYISPIIEIIPCVFTDISRFPLINT